MGAMTKEERINDGRHLTVEEVKMLRRDWRRNWMGFTRPGHKGYIVDADVSAVFDYVENDKIAHTTQELFTPASEFLQNLTLGHSPCLNN